MFMWWMDGWWWWWCERKQILFFIQQSRSAGIPGVWLAMWKIYFVSDERIFWVVQVWIGFLSRGPSLRKFYIPPGLHPLKITEVNSLEYCLIPTEEICGDLSSVLVVIFLQFKLFSLGKICLSRFAPSRKWHSATLIITRVINHSNILQQNGWVGQCGMVRVV